MTDLSFLAELQLFFERMSLALPDPRARHRVAEMGIGLLCGETPKTIASALEWIGTQGDWSADYRIFSKTRWRTNDLFAPLLAEATARSGKGPIVAAMDDSLLRKTGRKIPGASYARDPLSPPFHTNLVLGQRFLQTSVMARAGGDRPWRAVPVALRHAPPLKAPRGATDEQKRAVKEARKQYNISAVGREELFRLRAEIDRLPDGSERNLILTADGSFANRSFLQEVPDRTTVVARLRRNARLRRVLPLSKRKGNRKYGEPLPTPEEMLRDARVRTRRMTVYVSGRRRRLRYKVVENVCWPRVTRDRPATLILLKPLRYRLRKGGKPLYKQSAYLFVVGDEAQVRQVIRAYLLRWEIEVNFRDEKTILGVGKAQVWNPTAVERAPAFLIACYAAMLLASMKVLKDRRDHHFDALPPWRNDEVRRPSARDLVRLLRKQVREERKLQSTQQLA